MGIVVTGVGTHKKPFFLSFMKVSNSLLYEFVELEVSKKIQKNMT